MNGYLRRNITQLVCGVDGAQYFDCSLCSSIDWCVQWLPLIVKFDNKHPCVGFSYASSAVYNSTTTVHLQWPPVAWTRSMPVVVAIPLRMASIFAIIAATSLVVWLCFSVSTSWRPLLHEEAGFFVRAYWYTQSVSVYQVHIDTHLVSSMHTWYVHFVILEHLIMLTCSTMLAFASQISAFEWRYGVFSPPFLVRSLENEVW